MNRLFFAAFLPLLCFISPALADDAPFRQVTGDYALTFPRDHGAHRDFETEWWYVTGHIKDDENATFGFELVFFRVGMRQDPGLKSDWKMDSFYFAHFALTDD